MNAQFSNAILKIVYHVPTYFQEFDFTKNIFKIMYHFNLNQSKDIITQSIQTVNDTSIIVSKYGFMIFRDVVTYLHKK